MFNKESEALRIVGLKLEADREELVDNISSSLSSSNAGRIEDIYNSIIKLATIEKSIEINTTFQLQIRRDFLEMEDYLSKSDSTINTPTVGVNDFPKDDEELTK
jgi:hypothetical protein